MRYPFNLQIVNGVPTWNSDKAISSASSISATVINASSQVAARFQQRKAYRPAFGANIVIDFALGDFAIIIANAATAFTINAPLNDPALEGTEFAVQIVNASGGALGAVTWNAAYIATTGIAYPATGNSRTYDFYRVLTKYIQDASTSDTVSAT